MISERKALKTLKSDVKMVSIERDFDNELIRHISNLYKERLLVNEREEKIMMDKLMSASQGKEIVLENSTNSSI